MNFVATKVGYGKRRVIASKGPLRLNPQLVRMFLQNRFEFGCLLFNGRFVAVIPVECEHRHFLGFDKLKLNIRIQRFGRLRKKSFFKKNKINYKKKKLFTSSIDLYFEGNMNIISFLRCAPPHMPAMCTGAVIAMASPAAACCALAPLTSTGVVMATASDSRGSLLALATRLAFCGFEKTPTFQFKKKMSIKKK